MTHWKRWLIVLPARLQSTRLPEKPLQDLGGRPLIVRVFDRLKPLIEQGAEVVVATDSNKVLTACEAHQVPCEMTSEGHQSGTDRVHEISQKHDRPFVLNVQGDEPFVELAVLEKLALRMDSRSDSEMGTVVFFNRSVDDFQNPNIVKAVVTHDHALYFSRAPIPYHRDDAFQGFYHHQGIYAFRRETLHRFCQQPVDPLENLEKLEQLRALGLGIAILTVEAEKPVIGIDTPADLEEARELFDKV